jgi:hypothetical protein
MVVHGKGAHIRTANRAMHNFCKCPSERLTGQHLARVLRDPQNGDGSEHGAVTTLHDRILNLRTGFDTELPVRVSVSPLDVPRSDDAALPANAAPYLVLCVPEAEPCDSEERQSAEAGEEQPFARARAISHEFNNVLMTIVGYGRVLVDDPNSNSDQHTAARNVLEAGMRTRDLMEALRAQLIQADPREGPSHKFDPRNEHS